MARLDSTPDCGIRECPRAEYRAGLCRMHYDMTPSEDRYARAIAQMMETHERAKERRAAVVAELQAKLDAA